MTPQRVEAPSTIRPPRAAAARRPWLFALAWLLWWAAAAATTVSAARLGLIWESQVQPYPVVLELGGERHHGALSRAWDGAWQLHTDRGTLYPSPATVSPLLAQPGDRRLPWRPVLLAGLALGCCAGAYGVIIRPPGRGSAAPQSAHARGAASAAAIWKQGRNRP